MSRHLILIIGITFILLVNTAIFTTLYFAGIIWQPSKEEIAALALAEQKLRDEAEEKAKYAHLKPLPEFKSKVDYVRSMGEAIDICVAKLQEKGSARKSWSVNHFDSRHLPENETYKIFIDYLTIVARGEEPKKMKVICEVEEATKVISTWKPMKVK